MQTACGAARREPGAGGQSRSERGLLSSGRATAAAGSGVRQVTAGPASAARGAAGAEGGERGQSAEG